MQKYDLQQLKLAPKLHNKEGFLSGVVKCNLGEINWEMLHCLFFITSSCRSVNCAKNSLYAT